jgi:hypothetical protein
MHGQAAARNADQSSSDCYAIPLPPQWHNGRTLGYEPWFVGFNESWFPELYINVDNLMRYAKLLDSRRQQYWSP